MDLNFIRKLSISTTVWLCLYISISSTTIISRATSFIFVTWTVYTVSVAIAFTSLKLWNRSLQEPLLDVNFTHLETGISIILAVLVAVFGAILMQLDAMKDFVSSQILTFVMTTCQFNLLKSVQPDPASPTHGFNRIVSISRPIYFCLLSSLLLACEAYISSSNVGNAPGQRPSLVFYSFDIFDKYVVRTIGNASLMLIMIFPIIFLLGLLPQITTFMIHIFEQIDMHIFGSTASTLGLRSAAYSIFRSSIAVILLYLISLQSVGNNILLSLFFGILISAAYFLSRNSSDVTITYRLLKRAIKSFNKAKYQLGSDKIELEVVRSSDQQVPQQQQQQTEEIQVLSDVPQPPPQSSNPPPPSHTDTETESITKRIQSSIDDISIARLRSDLLRCICTTIVIFTLHVTSVFSLYHHNIDRIFISLAVPWGLLFHFVIPQLRRDIPCKCLAKPVLRSKEHDLFEVKMHAKLMWFEKTHLIGISIERNLIYPLFWLNVISHDVITIREVYGQHIGPLLLVIMSLKLIRSSFNDASPNYIIIVFTQLYFNYDIRDSNYSQMFTLNYFVFSILYHKIQELLLKLEFIYIYIAPWQIPWGSAFHAFAQPFSVPHSALLFFQAILSTILSAPLQPILGSAIFMMSYVRPVKFWERDYNTNVIDNNSTRLVTQLERHRVDSNRLDGIFYEHLTRCLQRKLCRDLSLGRWGPVSQGDCFIMASDNLNCLVHIIEFGNGLCTFQLRGLEFRGTYCQQQEVEAITERVGPDDGFCCCRPGHLPHFLSANAAFNQMWLAWHVTHTRYVLEGYTISDNLAGPILQPFDLRRALITYYVKAMIYFAMTSAYLSEWLRTKEFHDALDHTREASYADLDPTFSASLDMDFDVGLCGVTRAKFCSVYYDWIEYCFNRVKTDKKDKQRAELIADLECSNDSFIVTLCYGLSLIARRSLSAVADGQQFHTVESLLHGLHALLKGDFRVTSIHDEWIFQEIRFFKLVVIPAVRMSLKLHLDHFTSPDDYDNNMALYEAIAGYQKNLVISHETDKSWREAVLSGVPSLLTLRLYSDDGGNQYKFIMLNRRYLSFRIIKINRECVRGLWASQQQELIFFRNTDPERGSIQNAKQALRNMVNSSCDQPVGYPIYVSPLTISYVECESLSSFINK